MSYATLFFSDPPFLIFQEEEEVTAEFLAGKVPEIVYKKAIQCIPGAVINNFIVNQLAILTCLQYKCTM